MAASKPPDEQPLSDDTALLTTALNYYWAWHDVQAQRAYQVLNYYIVVSAILFTAYASAINGKHYSIGAAIAAAGLAFTVQTAVSEIYQVNAAAKAVPVLTELQNRMADRLRIDQIQMAKFQAREAGQKRAGFAITFGLATLFNTGGLVLCANPMNGRCHPPRRSLTASGSGGICFGTSSLRFQPSL
jgi:hypothetical protein